MRVQMRLKKETKGTVVYEAIHDDAGITTVYVRKSEMTKPYPVSTVITFNPVQQRPGDEESES